MINNTIKLFLAGATLGIILASGFDIANNTPSLFIGVELIICAIILIILFVMSIHKGDYNDF